MRNCGAITKKRAAGGGLSYAFRGIDDVYNALHDYLADAGIYMIPEVIEERSEERTNLKGTVLIYRFLKVRYQFIAEDGSSVTATGMGEAMDSGDKATNKAMSAAHKYVMMQTFLIPTEEAKDVELDHHQVQPKKQHHPIDAIPLLYAGDPRQKAELFKIFQNLGVKEPSLMKTLESKIIGKQMNEIKGLLLEQIEGMKNE